jgi:hypothetical protein
MWHASAVWWLRSGCAVALGVGVACGGQEDGSGGATGGSAGSTGGSAGSSGGSAGSSGGSAGSSAGTGGVSSAGAGGGSGAGGIGGGAAGSAGQSAGCVAEPGGLALEMIEPFVPTEAAPVKQLLLPAPAGLVFARMQLEVDVTHGGWYAPKPDGAHGVFQITVGNKWAGSLYGFMPWRGPPSKLIRVNANIGLPQGDMSQLQTTKLLEAQKKYHVRYDYDGATLTRSLTITSDGETIVQISKLDAVATVTSVAPGYPILLGTELACDGCGPEVPLYGWKLENLCVRLSP